MEEFIENLTSRQKRMLEKKIKEGLIVESIADGVLVMVGGPENRIMIMPSGKKKKFR